MKRIAVLALVLILVLSMSSVAFAEPAQVGYGILEELMSGAVVRVIVDLTDNWSVGFHPAAFYLFDHPERSNDEGYLAYGTLLSEKSFASLLEAHEGSERTDEDGTIVFRDSEGDTSFVAPVGDGLYLLLIVYSDAADPAAVWARVSCEREDYDFADPVQTASGVLADIKNNEMLVNVTVDLSYGWSVRFLPAAFGLYNEDTAEEDFDVYGTLLNETDFALIQEAHADDETFVEKDGVFTYSADGYTGIIAPVPGAENEYITLIVYGHYDPEAMWERISYELF